MSFPHNGRLWIATKADLKDVFLKEKVLKELGPIKERRDAHRLIGNILSRYIVLCNNLSEIYDQTLQSEKRRPIENILISTRKRFFELQQLMRKIEMSEFVYMDEALVELKMTPQNVEFLLPFYFPRKRDVEAQRIVDEVPKPARESVQAEAPKGLDKFKVVLTPEELEAKRQRQLLESAINLIKAHEKAKQTRIHSLNMKLFPEMFKIEESGEVPFDYEFIHRPDQAPLFKIKHTSYKINLYLPKLKVTRFSFYKPPVFRFNKLGQKVLVPKKKSAKPDQAIDDSDIEDDAKVDNLEKDGSILLREQKQLKAASIIQKCFRNYQFRKLVKKRELIKMEICGLARKAEDHAMKDLKILNEAALKRRRERKKEFDTLFIEAVEDEKVRILKLKSDAIIEDISDEIRQWFQEFYDTAKDFDRYPEEFEGGTILVVTGQTLTAEEFLVEKNKTPAQKIKDKENKKKEKKEMLKKKKKDQAMKKKLDDERKKIEAREGPTWDFKEERFDSKDLDDMENMFDAYQNEWQFIGELDDRLEAPVWDSVVVDAYSEVHKQLRLVVDEFMRIELELLRESLAADEKTKFKAAKPKKEKKKRTRKPKPAADEGQTLEESYEQLKSLNIIRKFEKKSLDDFIGDQNFAAHELRLKNKEALPFYGDIKNILRTLVLGMGPIELPKVKSLCIAGPPRSGKKLIVEALCTEMNAVMFDLSAKNVAKIGDMKQFLAFLMEIAVKLQPTVLFIDGAHKPFITKIPEHEVKEDPKKISSFLMPDILKKISPADAIMLIGTTNDPANCNYGQLKRVFEKIVCFPPTLDYGTALMVWQKGLERKKLYNFNVSSLATASRSFTIGDILESIDSHVNIRRRLRLSREPLTCHELLESLITAKKPLDEKTINSFIQISTKGDAFSQERKKTIARVQLEIDKEKQAKSKKK